MELSRPQLVVYDHPSRSILQLQSDVALSKITQLSPVVQQNAGR